MIILLSCHLNTESQQM